VSKQPIQRASSGGELKTKGQRDKRHPKQGERNAAKKGDEFQREAEGGEKKGLEDRGSKGILMRTRIKNRAEIAGLSLEGKKHKRGSEETAQGGKRSKEGAMESVQEKRRSSLCKMTRLRARQAASRKRTKSEVPLKSRGPCEGWRI